MVCDPERVDSADVGGGLSDAEFRELVRLLVRFAEHDLDQWAQWQLRTSDGPIYVQVLRELLEPDWHEEAFAVIWPLPAHLSEISPRRAQETEPASRAGGP